MLGRAATDGIAKRIKLDLLQMSVFNEDRDSTKAAELMAEMGVGCIVTLGGGRDQSGRREGVEKRSPGRDIHRHE